MWSQRFVAGSWNVIVGILCLSVPYRNPHLEVLSSLWGEVDALQSRLHPHTHRYRELLNNVSYHKCMELSCMTRYKILSLSCP